MAKRTYKTAEPYLRAKERAKARSSAVVLAGQDIAPLPDRVDQARRSRADTDFRFFCETYYGHVFTRAWSKDHLRVIEKIERVVRNRETLAVAMPRGSGKTTLCRVAVQWAILTGQHPFVMLIDATVDRSGISLSNIKRLLLANGRLLEDYPEALYPIRRLEGESKRSIGQRYYGVPTGIGWGMDEIVMPTIPGSRCSGAIIQVAGILGNIRGALHVRADGTQVRPTLVVCDDPQTDESARSIVQTAERLSVIHGAISGLAGPGEHTAVVIPCTVIQSGDLADKLLDRKQSPSWYGERTKMVYSFPANTNLWDEYRKIRDDCRRRDKSTRQATEFYRQRKGLCGLSLGDARPCPTCDHRATCMDCGAVVAWPDRYDKAEVSALQNAMDVKFDIGEQAFSAEYQNSPMIDKTISAALTTEEVAGRFNGRPQREVPLSCTQLTMFVDVHKEVLFYCVAGWQEDCAGYIVDYGTWPSQNRLVFNLSDAPRKLSMQYSGADEDGAIQAGLTELVQASLSKEWPKAGGGVLRIGRLLVDSGYKPGIVAAVKHQCGGATMVLSKGVGIRAGNRPMSSYQKKPGESYGHHWYMPRVAGTQEFPHVAVDVNWWKSFVHAHLQIAPGDPGALTLFGASADPHWLFAEHVANSEFYVVTQGFGREVQEWRPKPTRPDGHFFDALVGCAAAASMLGCATPEMSARPRREVKRTKFSQIAGVTR